MDLSTFIDEPVRFVVPIRGEDMKRPACVTNYSITHTTGPFNSPVVEWCIEGIGNIEGVMEQLWHAEHRAMEDNMCA